MVIILALAIFGALAVSAPAFMWRLYLTDRRLAVAEGRKTLWLTHVLAASLTGVAVATVYLCAIGILRQLYLPSTPAGHTVFPEWVATSVDLARGVIALSLGYLFIACIRNA